ncbi:hypothetical protein [Enterococcus sp. S86.2]|uniref:hypothetical protein n=1 Tax=Enterococcus sp. S86.2 TaxID=3031299 RepID=UPI0026EEB765|nr:hypothetical protein [Enterococcus sp. S86.2]
MAKANKKFDEDFKKTILDLNQSGQSVEELAEQLGTEQSLYQRLVAIISNSRN